MDKKKQSKTKQNKGQSPMTLREEEAQPQKVNQAEMVSLVK